MAVGICVRRDVCPAAGAQFSHAGATGIGRPQVRLLPPALRVLICAVDPWRERIVRVGRGAQREWSVLVKPPTVLATLGCCRR
jgi:hypothetical protein